MRPTSESARLRKLLLLCAALLLGGWAYALFCRLTGWGIPCLFRLVTGWQCPGCGVSRMCLSLLRGDLRAAWRYNAAILCLLPALLALGGNLAFRYVRFGSLRPSRWADVLIWLMVAVLLVFGLCRNLEAL